MNAFRSPALPQTARLALGRHWVSVGAFALVAGTGFVQGGYFPDTWGWPALGAAWAAALAALSRERTALTRTSAAAAGLLAALAAWTALSTAWSVDVTQSALYAERVAIYAAALLAALLWAGRRPERLLHGAWAAISVVSGWALLTRLVPDRFGVVDAIGGYRLAEPIGYWNTLGLVAGMGALLALGLGARARSYAGRAAAGFSLPLLLTTLYFTYSRGAWAALGCGLAATLLLERRRLQLGAVLIAAAPWTALAVYLAATSSALTTKGAPLPQMAAQGHRLLLWLVLLALASGAAAAALRPLEPRLALPESWRRWTALVLAVAVVSGLAVAFDRYGSPVHLASHAWSSFAHGSTAGSSSDLNNRLFHLSGSGRVTQWRIAWHEAQQYPWLGSGAGTYADYWNRHRPVASRVQDVHNLYLETLAELGPLGLLLLAGALCLPLVAAVRGRHRPVAAAALGAYVAYLAHAAVDWDWELPAATLAFLLCGATLLSSQRRERRPWRPVHRYVALATASLLAITGLHTIASRIPLQRLGSETARWNWPAAEKSAQRASELAPWSSEPWIDLGEGELRGLRADLARAAFRKAVAAEPDEWLGWHDLARATSGREHARAERRARELNPLTP